MKNFYLIFFIFFKCYKNLKNKMSSDISTVGNVDNYEYLKKFIKNYKPLRSGMETLFSRHKKYYRDKFFDELKNTKVTVDCVNLFYCSELEKLTRYYNNIDIFKNLKHFQLEINVELFANLLKRDYSSKTFFESLDEREKVDELLIFIMSTFAITKSIFYLSMIIFLSILLEKDIREVKNIECLKSMYYVFGKKRCVIISVYKLINIIHDIIINCKFDEDQNIEIKSKYEIIDTYIYGFFKKANEIFIDRFKTFVKHYVYNLKKLKN